MNERLPGGPAVSASSHLISIRLRTIHMKNNSATTSASLEKNTVASTLSIPSPRGTTCSDSCLQPGARNSLGTLGHLFEGPPAPGEPSSALFGNSKNLASSYCRAKPIDTCKIAEQREGLRKEPQNCTIPTRRFARNFATWNP